MAQQRAGLGWVGLVSLPLEQRPLVLFKEQDSKKLVQTFRQYKILIYNLQFDAFLSHAQNAPFCIFADPFTPCIHDGVYERLLYFSLQEGTSYILYTSNQVTVTSTTLPARFTSVEDSFKRPIFP